MAIWTLQAMDPSTIFNKTSQDRMSVWCLRYSPSRRLDKPSLITVTISITDYPIWMAGWITIILIVSIIHRGMTVPVGSRALVIIICPLPPPRLVIHGKIYSLKLYSMNRCDCCYLLLYALGLLFHFAFVFKECIVLHFCIATATGQILYRQPEHTTLSAWIVKSVGAECSGKIPAFATVLYFCQHHPPSSSSLLRAWMQELGARSVWVPPRSYQHRMNTRPLLVT